jgi:hypothetical protein
MKKVKIIIPIIIIIIIASSLIIFTPNQEITKNKIDEKWIKSGPFEIDKKQYNIGEKIFVNTINLKSNDKGEIQILRPINDTHHKVYIQIPFDGSKKDNFNYYFEPSLYSIRGMCSMNDIAGNWVMTFPGTVYEDLNFEIINQTSSWDDRNYDPIC